MLLQLGHNFLEVFAKTLQLLVVLLVRFSQHRLNFSDFVSQQSFITLLRFKQLFQILPLLVDIILEEALALDGSLQLAVELGNFQFESLYLTGLFKDFGVESANFLFMVCLHLLGLI